MTKLQMIGWQPGLRTVSLVQLLKDKSTGSLAAAKTLADSLLDGEVVEIGFKTVAEAQAFREHAESLGVIIGPADV
jgi:hypothetical protein